MKRFIREEKGQSLAELAIVFIIFYFFVIGIIQLTLLGHGYIKVQQIARRAAWHGSYYNNRFKSWNNETYDIESQLRLLGSNTADVRPRKISGNRNEGFVYELSYNVPAIGYFNLLWPKGYKTITTTTAVIAYTPHPVIDKYAIEVQGDLSKILNKVSTYFKETLGL